MVLGVTATDLHIWSAAIMLGPADRDRRRSWASRRPTSRSVIDSCPASRRTAVGVSRYMRSDLLVPGLDRLAGRSVADESDVSPGKYSVGWFASITTMNSVPTGYDNHMTDAGAQRTVQTSSTNDANIRELIITLYGLYARAEKNWLSVAAIVRLMGHMGADEPLVRSSIYRLKQRGVLESMKTGSTAGYALSESSIQSYAEGDARIFGRRRARVNDGWLVLVFSIPESRRDKRHDLRTQLLRLNFGTAAPGTWIAPGNLHQETQSMLEKHRLTEFVDIFRGDHLAFGDIRTKVTQWWDFDELTRSYGQFITKYGPMLGQPGDFPSGDDGAFVAYMNVLTSWRSIPDPRLAREFLPEDWNGLEGDALFAALSRRLEGPARRHAMSALHRFGAGGAVFTGS